MVVRRRLASSALAVLLLACSGKDATDSRSSAPEPSGGGAAGASGGGSAPKAGQPAQGGSDSVGPDTPLEDFPRVYARAVCSAFERCWTAFIDATGGHDGCQRLVEGLAREGLFSPYQQAVADGRISYHPEALPGCLEALDAASCAGFDDAWCPEVFSGTRQQGEACELDEECEGDAQCLVGSSCPGTCGPRPGLGEACSDTNTCARGLRCAEAAEGAEVCVEPAGLAESCGTFRPCAGLLYCRGADAGSSELAGTCVERALPHDGEAGAACDGLGVDKLCKPGFVCSFVQENGETVGRCQPQAPAGGACTYSLPDACPPNEYCHIETALGEKPVTGTCSPQPDLGQTCRYGTIHVAPCGVDRVCHPDSGVCVTAKHLGEACTSGQECVSGDCDDGGRCVALLECEEAAAEAP